jgi:hypothetical protein
MARTDLWAMPRVRAIPPNRFQPIWNHRLPPFEAGASPPQSVSGASRTGRQGRDRLSERSGCGRADFPYQLTSHERI